MKARYLVAAADKTNYGRKKTLILGTFKIRNQEK